MARTGLTTAVVQQLESRFVRLGFLFQLQFADATIYAWSGCGTVNWNGNNYLGVGTYGSISGISETGTVEAQGITLTLSGADLNNLRESLNEINHAGKAYIYVAFFDATGAIIANPSPAYIGIMDKPHFNIDTGDCSISIDVENRLADLNRARGGRYTDQDQRARYPQDGSLRYVPYNQDRNIIWKS